MMMHQIQPHTYVQSRNTHAGFHLIKVIPRMFTLAEFAGIQTKMVNKWSGLSIPKTVSQ